MTHRLKCAKTEARKDDDQVYYNIVVVRLKPISSKNSPLPSCAPVSKYTNSYIILDRNTTRELQGRTSTHTAFLPSEDEVVVLFLFSRVFGSFIWCMCLFRQIVTPSVYIIRT